MSRLPTPGGDDNDWGNILNAFLEISHANDGTLLPNAISAAGGYIRPNSGIPSSDTSAAVQTSLGLANTSIQLGGDIGGTTTTPLVTKLQGTTVNAASPTSNQVLAYNSVSGAWVPSTVSSTTINDATTVTPGIIQLDGDLSGSASSPTVAKLNGIALSGTPNSGEALVATSANAATWSAISGTTSWINVATGYGADVTGVADSTAAIQNAINAATKDQIVYLPAGNYLLNSPAGLTLNAAGGSIVGDGVGATTITIGASFSGASAIAITAPSCSVRQLTIVGANATISGNPAADGITITGASYCRLEDLYFEYVNGWCIEAIGSASTGNIATIIQNVIGIQVAGGIHAKGVSGSHFNGQYFINNIQFGQVGTASGASANLDSFMFEDILDIMGSNWNSSISNVGTGSTLHIKGKCASIYITNPDLGCYPNTSATNSVIFIEDSTNGSPSGVNLVNGIAQQGGIGVQITGGAGRILFESMSFQNNQTHGTVVSGTGSQIVFSNCTWNINGQSATGTIYDLDWSGTAVGEVRGCYFKTSIVAVSTIGVQYSVNIALGQNVQFWGNWFAATGAANSNWYTNLPEGYSHSGGLDIEAATASRGGLLQITQDTSAPSNPGIMITGQNTTDNAMGFTIPGDTISRMLFTADGTQQWGPGGSTVTDIQLQRSNTAQLSITGRGGSSPTLKISSPVSGPSNAPLQIQSSSSGDLQIAGDVSGDSANRWKIDSNGQLKWGPGTAAVDTNLYRSSSGLLKTDDSFTVAQALAAGTLAVAASTNALGGLVQITQSQSAPASPGINITGQTASNSSLAFTVSGDTVGRHTFTADGTQQWGPGGSSATDIQMQRTGTAQLSVTGLNSNSPTLKLQSSVATPSSPLLQFQSNASGDLEAGGSVTGDTANRWKLDSNGKMQWGPGNTAIDTNLYRASSGLLQTDDSLTVSQTLTAGILTSPTVVSSGLTGATATSRYVGATTSGHPTAGTFALGDYVIDQTGNIWVCTAAGTGGGASWASVTGAGGVTLDSTATDIQPLGTQAAGSTGRAADAGHVHSVQGFLPATPSQLGLVAWNYPSLWATAQGPALTSGVRYLLRIQLSGVSVTIHNVLIAVWALGSGLTSSESYIGLYDNNGSQIGVSGDQSAAWESGGTSGVNTIALTGAPFTGTWPFVYVALVSNGATLPTFARAGGITIGTSLINLGATGSNLPFTSNGTGITLPSGGFTYSSNATTTGASIWCALS